MATPVLPVRVRYYLFLLGIQISCHENANRVLRCNGVDLNGEANDSSIYSDKMEVANYSNVEVVASMRPHTENVVGSRGKGRCGWVEGALCLPCSKLWDDADTIWSQGKHKAPSTTTHPPLTPTVAAFITVLARVSTLSQVL